MSENEFLCRPLSSEDWMFYRDVQLMLLEDQNEMERKAMLESRNAIHWRSELQDPRSKKFVLFDGQKPIGMTIINFPEFFSSSDCEFTGSYILRAYRNRGLGDFLYQARLDYLREIKAAGKILTKIWVDNAVSQAVATRNGFLHARTAVQDGATYNILTREP